MVSRGARPRRKTRASKPGLLRSPAMQGGIEALDVLDGLRLIGVVAEFRGTQRGETALPRRLPPPALIEIRRHPPTGEFIILRRAAYHRACS